MNVCSQRIRLLTAGSLREFGLDDLPRELAALSKADAPITWIHMEPSATGVQALDDMGLDEVAVKSLRDGPERPRVEEFADHIYISLFSADRPAAEKAIERCPADESPPVPASGGSLPTLKELRLFLGPRWIISVGEIDQQEYEMLVDRMNRQVFSRGRGPSFVAYHICEWLVESLQPTLERLDDRIDALEDQVVLASGEAPMQELFSLKRDLVDLRRRVAPLRDVMQRLGAGRTGCCSSRPTLKCISATSMTTSGATSSCWTRIETSYRRPSICICRAFRTGSTG